MQLIRKAELARRFGLTGAGFSKMAARVEGFPRPVKTGTSRQASVYFDACEVAQWLESQKEKTK